MNNETDIYIEEIIKKYGSAIEAKKWMMKEYLFKLNEIIQNGVVYRDERVESLQIQWQNYFNILEKIIDEEQRENALDNMELIDEDENYDAEYTSYSLAEITQDILDHNDVGGFSGF